MTKSNFPHNLLARFMRAFFYLLYQPFAWSYDLVAAVVSWGRWQDWVFSVLPYLDGPTILELGHGPGHLQKALHERALAPFGLDLSRQMGHQARKRLARKGFPNQLTCGYTQAIPFRDSCCDQVVATFPTEYIAAPETLTEIYRVLKPGGILVVLPAAWITGKRLSDRGTAQLFKITGQAPAWDEKWLLPFAQAGYQARAEMIRQKSWSVVIILAQKPSTENSKAS